MTLAASTGTPPAVTHDQVDAWGKLADDVTAALVMGGHQGLDFLVNLMAEWCEAVDDVNTARQICVDFAARGLRDEAIHWHAEGFFDVADRLDPDRPGWESWEEALRERDIVTPRIDPILKEMANRIHQDLAIRDLAGQSLADYLGRLRRNVLLRGHLGERLVILESIRGLDPGGRAWQEMIDPIRRRRVDMIADEVRAALERKDLDALASLRDEVAAQEWGDGLPANVAPLLEAAANCVALAEYRGPLKETADAIVARCREAREKPASQPTVAAVVRAANAERERYGELRAAAVQAVRAAGSVPEVAAIVADSGITDLIRQLNAILREPCEWLDQQTTLADTRARVATIEAALLRVVEGVPRKSSDRDVFGRQFAQWQEQAARAMEKARKAAALLPDGIPDAIDAVFKKVADAIADLERHRESLDWRERMLVYAVLGGVGAVALAIVVTLAIAMALR